MNRPATLGDLLRQGYDVRAYCGACGHYVIVSARELAASKGEGAGNCSTRCSNARNAARTAALSKCRLAISGRMKDDLSVTVATGGSQDDEQAALVVSYRYDHRIGCGARAGTCAARGPTAWPASSRLNTAEPPRVVT